MDNSSSGIVLQSARQGGSCLVVIEGGRGAPRNVARINALIESLTEAQLVGFNKFLLCLRCPLSKACIPFKLYEQADPDDPLNPAFGACARRRELEN
jgi:hypothetical protein